MMSAVNACFSYHPQCTEQNVKCFLCNAASQVTDYKQSYELYLRKKMKTY